MGLFDRVERKLESAVNGAFARAFRAEVQPVEIASAMRRAMDDRAAIVGHGRTVVPNLFLIDLSPSDYERLTSYAEVLTDELVASAQEHAEQQRYRPGGPFHVDFRSRDDLETGVFRVRPATAKRRPDPPEYRGESDQAAEDRRRARSEELRRAHPFRPAEAQAPAQGAAGMASHAASAAAGSLAGTAAARQAGAGPFAPPADGAGRDDPPSPPRPAQHGGAGEGDVRAAPAGPFGAPPPVRPAPAPVRPAPPREDPPPPLVLDPTERPWLELHGDHYPLLGARTVLGRDSSADITLDDAGVSRRHAEIRVTHDGPHFAVTIRDLNSTNGTFVNGDRVDSRRLQDGDRLTLGRSTLAVRTGRR